MPYTSAKKGAQDVVMQQVTDSRLAAESPSQSLAPPLTLIPDPWRARVFRQVVM